MVGDARIEDWMDAEFGRARRRSGFRRAVAWVRREPSRKLTTFEEAKARMRGARKVPLGLMRVPMEKITGSVGRPKDFDRDFLPTTSSGAERWKRVNRMYRTLGEFPPIKLYKIGDDFFVLDGNHRVSVARYHGEKDIEADVVEFLPHTSEPSPDAPSRANITHPETPHTSA